MRVERRRKKKLLVAFHFSRANKTAWECDSCRRAGLESVRNCAMHDGGQDSDNSETIVWAHRDIIVDRCPICIISAASVAWLDRYYIWKTAGCQLNEEMSSRDMEAFLTLMEVERSEILDAHNSNTR